MVSNHKHRTTAKPGAGGEHPPAPGRADRYLSTDESTSASTAEATTTVSETPEANAEHSGQALAEEAAQRYLEIVRPYNEALEDLERGVNSGRSLDTVTGLAGAVAEANAAHIEELADTNWPTDVQSAVDDLIAESTAAQEYWEDAAAAETYDGFIEAVLAAGEHDGTEAAEIIRELLNLDEYDESDYD